MVSKEMRLLKYVLILFISLGQHILCVVSYASVNPTRGSPSSWFKLECTFNKVDINPSKVTLTDGIGDPIYTFRNDNGRTIKTIGDLYKSPFERGEIKEFLQRTDRHVMSLKVKGICAKNPYTFMVWGASKPINKITPYSTFVNLKYSKIRPNTVFTRIGEDSGKVSTFKLLRDNYTLICEVEKATLDHKIILKVEVNDKVVQDKVGVATRDSNCYYSTKVQTQQVLFRLDPMEIGCNVKYSDGAKLGYLYSTKVPPYTGGAASVKSVFNAVQLSGGVEVFGIEMPLWVFIILVTLAVMVTTIVVSAVGVVLANAEHCAKLLYSSSDAENVESEKGFDNPCMKDFMYRSHSMPSLSTHHNTEHPESTFQIQTEKAVFRRLSKEPEKEIA